MALVALVDELRTKAFGSITNSYTTVGSPLSHATRIFRIINSTDADMLFSLDGSTNMFYLPANSFVLYDLATNAEKSSEMFVLQIGTQFYVKFVSAPSKNSVAIEAVYGRGQ